MTTDDMSVYRRRLMKVFARFKSIKLNEYMGGLYPPEFKTLKTICDLMEEKREVHVSDIVKKTCVPASAVSRSMNSLEKKGFILRDVDPDDRRSTLVRVTPDGGTLIARCVEEMDDLTSRVFRRMGKDEADSLLRSLEMLADVALDELRNDMRSGK